LSKWEYIKPWCSIAWSFVGKPSLLLFSCSGGSIIIQDSTHDAIANTSAEISFKAAVSLQIAFVILILERESIWWAEAFQDWIRVLISVAITACSNTTTSALSLDILTAVSSLECNMSLAWPAVLCFDDVESHSIFQIRSLEVLISSHFRVSRRSNSS